MCNPAALAVASTSVQLLGQSQQARAINKHQGQVYELNKESANENAILSYQQIQKRQQEESEKAAQAIGAAHKQATLASGRLITSMAEANVAGNTAATLLADFQRSEADYIQTTIRNRAFLDDQIKLEMQGVEQRRRAQIINGMATPAAGPDYLNAGVRLGAQMLSIDWAEVHQENPYAGIT